MAEVKRRPLVANKNMENGRQHCNKYTSFVDTRASAQKVISNEINSEDDYIVTFGILLQLNRL